MSTGLGMLARPPQSHLGSSARSSSAIFWDGTPKGRGRSLIFSVSQLSLLLPSGSEGCMVIKDWCRATAQCSHPTEKQPDHFPSQYLFPLFLTEQGLLIWDSGTTTMSSSEHFSQRRLYISPRRKSQRQHTAPLGWERNKEPGQ